MNLKAMFEETGLFINTAHQKRYFKAAFEGFSGSGKTYSMGQIARGIWEREGGESPVIIIDTEESAKYLVPLFEEVGAVEGENLVVSRSRSLVDFERILKLAEEVRGILLIDCVTHLHEEMVAQYLKDNRRARIKMEDHMILKPFWKEHFSTPYVRAQCHAMFTGRASWEYEAERNEETGKITDFVKSGVKMRGDNETAFEPDILVLMSRCQEVNAKGKIRVWREGMVMKSRYAPMDGKLFKDPSFKDFEPIYQFVMTGKTGAETRRETSMRGMFTDPSRSGVARRRAIEQLLGELKALYDSAVPGSGAKEKKMKSDIAFASFGKRSWEALEDSKLEDLQQGYRIAAYLMAHLNAMPDDLKEFPAWLEQQKAILASLVAETDEHSKHADDDVPLTGGPESPTLPQDDETVVGEGTRSHEETATTAEAASMVPVDDDQEPTEGTSTVTKDQWYRLSERALAVGLSQTTWETLLRAGDYFAARDTVEAIEDARA